MKTIPLTQGYEALVDDEDFERLSRWKWHASVQRKGKLVYARRTLSIGSVRRHVTLHRVVADAQDPETGASLTDLLVDHENRNTLDCRKGNLRRVTPRRNSWNRKPAENVTFWRGRWIAHVRVTAPTREEAVKIAQAMKKEARRVASD